MLRQYVKIAKRADVVQTAGAGAVAYDLELVLECAYIYDSLIMAIIEEKSNIQFN